MSLLDQLCQTVSRLFKQVFRLPQAMADAIKQRQQRVVLIELEAERLDRIRHPEKYRGK